MVKKILMFLMVCVIAWAQKPQPKLQDPIKVTGMGAPPANASPVQAKLLACRAAIADAYRQLGEVIQGVKVDSQTTVKDFVVQSDEIRTKVSALVKGAEEVSRRQLPDGSCEVTLQVHLQDVEKAMPPKVDIPPPPLPKSQQMKRSSTNFFGVHIKRGYWSSEVIRINKEGLNALRDKQYELAESLFRRCVEMDSSFDIGYNNLAIAIKRQGRLSEAYDAYQKAIQIDPKWSDHHVNLGWLLWDMGDKAKAAEEAEKALVLYSKNEWAHNLAGYIALKTGDTRDAIHHYSKAVENTPSDDPYLAKYFYYLGQAYKQSGDKGTAKRAFKQALSYRPDYWEVKEALKKL